MIFEIIRKFKFNKLKILLLLKKLIETIKNNIYIKNPL